MLNILGKPKKVEQIDESIKMYLYEQIDKGAFCYSHILRIFKS